MPKPSEPGTTQTPGAFRQLLLGLAVSGSAPLLLGFALRLFRYDRILITTLEGLGTGLGLAV